MDVLNLHVADYGMVDQAGKPSLIGIFRELWADRLPASFQPIMVAFELQASESELNEPQQLRLDFVDPDGRVLVRVEAALVISGDRGPGATATAWQLMQINGLRLSTEGDHVVNVFVNGACVRPLHVPVKLLPRSPQPGVPPEESA